MCNGVLLPLPAPVVCPLGCREGAVTLRDCDQVVRPGNTKHWDHHAIRDLSYAPHLMPHDWLHLRDLLHLPGIHQAQQRLGLFELVLIFYLVRKVKL